MGVSARQRASHRFPDPRPTPLLPFEVLAARGRWWKTPKAVLDQHADRRLFPGHPELEAPRPPPTARLSPAPAASPSSLAVLRARLLDRAA
jgi:hypothetical protein